MSSHDHDENNMTSSDADTYYEKVASREEIYEEDVEEEVREALTSDDPSSSQNNTNDSPRKGETLDEQLNEAAEELITGDGDDPPLGEGKIAEMLSVSRLFCSHSLVLQGHAVLALLIPVLTWF